MEQDSAFAAGQGGRSWKSYFKNYMDGLRRRQEAIADACRSRPEADVVYVDIKKFYDSISIGAARKAWGNFCTKRELESIHKDLGFKLIYNYSQHSNNESILTGPMFSHFLANLVLRPIDDICDKLDVGYVRYVDDLTFIGSDKEIDQAIATVSEALDKLGMTLHSADDPKTLRLTAREWLESTDDFKGTEDSLRWMHLVGNIKKNLLWNRGNNIELEESLISCGFRFPLPDYSSSIQELSAFEKIKTFGLWNWLFHRSRGATIPRIIYEAEQLRTSLENHVYAIFGQPVADISKFHRKRLVSKLRYRLGRLVYLSTEDTLRRLASLAKDWPELHLHAALLRSITTRDCSELIELGTNSAQAGAQIFRAMSETIKLSQPVDSPAAIQGLATFILNGVSIEGTIRSQNAPVLRFAQGPIDADLMRQPRGLIQELASLHGIGATRHAETIRTAFDVDQEIMLDALEFDYEYYI